MGQQQAKPAIPTWDAEPSRGWRSVLSSAMRASLVHARNRGWWGRTSLRRHVIICGFPRAGTSLLQVMVETAASGAHVFGTETRALRRARLCVFKQHATLVTKRTNDVFYVDEIRHFYRNTLVRPYFIVMIRDPRDVFTSFHTSHPGRYYVSPERWKALYEHLCYVRNFEDVLVIRYEDLVSDCEAIQRRLCEFAGLTTARSFRDFTDAVPEGFLTAGLNGIRPPDTKTIGRWKSPDHQQRIEDVLQALPALPDYLIDMGYEIDRDWVESTFQRPCAKTV